LASELDRQLRTIMDRLTAPRSIFERDVVMHSDTALPAFRNAPPTLAALFAHCCAEHSGREFIVDGETRLTFGQTFALARRAAIGLMERHGVRRGDRIGIAGANSANWIIAYMATIMAGGCATLLNGWWTGRELAEGVALSDCSLVLADTERCERLACYDPGIPIVEYGNGAPERALAAILAAPGAPDAPLPDIASTDLATILFTSGSTGRAKAAWSTHRAVAQAAMNFAAQSMMLSVQLTEVGTPPSDQQVALLCVPLFHVTGEIAVLLQSFMIGRKLVVMPKWDAREAMELIEREHVTFFIGVPLMGFQIATHPDRDSFDLSTCKSIAAGGAPRPSAHVARIREALPDAYPLMGYGLTETNCVGCTNFNENYIAKPGSTGPVSTPLVELAIFDADGQPVAPGERGEIAIRSVCNFGGYWNDEQATRQAIRDDGFFVTGDLGHIDEDGYLFVVGRMKDIIIRGGENISCTEVEQAIQAHPDIVEASVFGVADAYFGEIPVAVYSVRKDGCAGGEELRGFLSERLATFKIPAQFHRIDGPLPLLASHKVDKVALKARYSNEGDSAKSAA
jgi:acyl-CoA synthetase (AMP-forming)/AMP-acid ligase II